MGSRAGEAWRSVAPPLHLCRPRPSTRPCTAPPLLGTGPAPLSRGHKGAPRCRALRVRQGARCGAGPARRGAAGSAPAPRAPPLSRARTGSAPAPRAPPLSGARTGSAPASRAPPLSGARTGSAPAPRAPPLPGARTGSAPAPRFRGRSRRAPLGPGAVRRERGRGCGTERCPRPLAGRCRLSPAGCGSRPDRGWDRAGTGHGPAWPRCPPAPLAGRGGPQAADGAPSRSRDGALASRRGLPGGSPAVFSPPVGRLGAVSGSDRCLYRDRYRARIGTGTVMGPGSRRAPSGGHGARCSATPRGPCPRRSRCRCPLPGPGARPLPALPPALPAPAAFGTREFPQRLFPAPSGKVLPGMEMAKNRGNKNAKTRHCHVSQSSQSLGVAKVCFIVTSEPSADGQCHPHFPQGPPGWCQSWIFGAPIPSQH
ncbi:basic proline-rich protein-like [Passer domesticus]|uniref:basic proline-rich protein-like n=1 Tax=Passer domesticus TaxID=48849 RepID=UPI0030FF006E